MTNNIHNAGVVDFQLLRAPFAQRKGPPSANATDQQAARKTTHETARETAKSFETAFIAQMLQFSGLAKALTTGGGEAVESYTQFYLEELAKDISNNGGFGIAAKISTYIETKEETHGELGRL